MNAKNNEFASFNDPMAAMNAIEILSENPANYELIREISEELSNRATENINPTSANAKE